MLGKARSEPERPSVALVTAALQGLGASDIRWKGSTADLRKGGQRQSCELGGVLALLDAEPLSASPHELELDVAAALGWPVEPELMRDWDVIRHRLRPRLVTHDALAGAGKAMCRREMFGGLLGAVRVGPKDAAPPVTTRLLDLWGKEFDDVLAESCRNLRSTMDGRSLHEVEGTRGLYAVVHEDEPGSSCVFILDHMAPRSETAAGVVFAVPDRDVTLLLPVERGSGPAGLASLVDLTIRLADEGANTLTDQLFWKIDGRVIHLPVTVVEDETSRRVHLDASGPAEDLYRQLGAID